MLEFFHLTFSNILRKLFFIKICNSSFFPPLICNEIRTFWLGPRSGNGRGQSSLGRGSLGTVDIEPRSQCRGNSFFLFVSSWRNLESTRDFWPYWYHSELLRPLFLEPSPVSDTFELSLSWLNPTNLGIVGGIKTTCLTIESLQTWACLTVMVQSNSMHTSRSNVAVPQYKEEGISMEKFKGNSTQKCPFIKRQTYAVYRGCAWKARLQRTGSNRIEAQLPV